MRYVILRDDDTNALTPVGCLEKLYRPFLARGLPVNLATIPAVRRDACTPDGKREGFVFAAKGDEPDVIPISTNPGLAAYLRSNAGLHVVQHGCHHDPFEFDSKDRANIVRRLDEGAEQLQAAGLSPGAAFVAPHDKISRIAYGEIAKRFRIISSGWFEWRRIPPLWFPRYVAKKMLRRPHWRAADTQLLSHPGCILSYTRDPRAIVPAIRQVVERQELTVLVTHWWEYFRGGQPDEPFIAALHATAEYLASQADVRVISFEALANGELGAPNTDVEFTPATA